MSLSWNERQAQMIEGDNRNQCEWCFELVDNAIIYRWYCMDEDFTICESCAPKFEKFVKR